MASSSTSSSVAGCQLWRAALAGDPRGDALAVVGAGDEMGGQAEFELERRGEVERPATVVLSEGDLERGRRFLADLGRRLLGEGSIVAVFLVEPLKNGFDRRGGESVIDERRVGDELALARVAMKPVEQPVDGMVVGAARP